MKNGISFILFLVGIHILAQSSEPYTLVYIVNKTVDREEYVADEKVDKKDEVNIMRRVYGYNAKKDSVVYYSFYNSAVTENEEPSLYTLEKKTDKIVLHCKGSDESNMNLEFDSQGKTITINNKDIFYLNDAYYNYLHKSVYENLNIPDLLDFLEDFLEDYNIEELRCISSLEKYKHNDFRVLKAYMESYRSQASDYLDKWNIQFDYDGKGVLKYLLKESAEGDQALEKKILSHHQGVFRYAIHRNNESRLITDTKQTFDISKKVFNEKITAFQVGLGKETNFETKQKIYKTFPADHLYLKSKGVLEINKIKIK
ncbi:hypothetical protein [Chryseobacterium sp. MYb328]|uniref:hypothetical protein n=1 Tax=Chryseobacterium sp. MYb328 TaxID=2745231 RepID=UPI0030A8B90B